MLSTTCCNVVLHTVQQCCAAPCQQLLSTTIVHSCSRSTTIVQSLLTINKLFSSTIVSSCCNDHRDYKRMEAASGYKFSQARGSNWSLLMGSKFKSRMLSQDVRSCIYWLLNGRLFTTRYDEKTRKGEGEKNKMQKKIFALEVFTTKINAENDKD